MTQDPEPGVVPAAQAAGRTAGPPTGRGEAVPGPWGPLEISAMLLLTVGSFLLLVIGPTIGVVLVWLSARWSRREKWIATVLGLLPLVLAVGALLSYWLGGLVDASASDGFFSTAVSSLWSLSGGRS